MRTVSSSLPKIPLINQVFLFGKHVSGFQLLRIAQHHGVLLRIDFQHVGRFAQAISALPLPDGVVRESFVPAQLDAFRN